MRWLFMKHLLLLIWYRLAHCQNLANPISIFGHISIHISGFKNIFNIIHLTKTHGKEGRVHGTATTHVYVMDQLVFYASSTQP